MTESEFRVSGHDLQPNEEEKQERIHLLQPESDFAIDKNIKMIEMVVKEEAKEHENPVKHHNHHHSEGNLQEGQKANRKPQRMFSLSRDPLWEWFGDELPNHLHGNGIRILVLTWNLQGKKAPENLSLLTMSEHAKHHIIAISTQECCRSIGASFFLESKKDWENKLKKNLGSEYEKVKSVTLNAMHLIVFSHKTIIPFIHCEESAKVKTGTGNILGNKGGVGISFKIGEKSFFFACCHLAAGHKKSTKRNTNLQRIEKNMNLPKKYVPSKKSSYCSDRFDFTFYSGDFNYRIEGSYEEICDKIKKHEHVDLLKHDQAAKHNVFKEKNFQEGHIQFPPTYKLKKDCKAYDYEAKRNPGWTDRIVYKGENNLITQKRYDSINNFLFSDHRAVFSQFHVILDLDPAKITTYQRKGQNSSTCNITQQGKQQQSNI